MNVYVCAWGGGGPPIRIQHSRQQKEKKRFDEIFFKLFQGKVSQNHQVQGSKVLGAITAPMVVDVGSEQMGWMNGSVVSPYTIHV